MKKLEIEYDECRSLASTVDQLQSVVDGLRSRALTIAHGDRRLLFLLAPGSPLELKIHAERFGNRERLEISLEWRRQHLRIGGVAASETAREGEGDELEEQPLAPAQLEEEQADPEELEENELHDESDEDDDDWDDQAETVRQGSKLLAEALQQNSFEH
jgi:amphi-Trp domain-containing protein